MTIQPGTRRIIEQVYTQHECYYCGEPATKTHTFLFENARRNPASSGYGKDDISWCSDAVICTCNDCREKAPDGMSWCATFSGPRFQHMLHFWREVSREEIPSDVAA